MLKKDHCKNQMRLIRVHYQQKVTMFRNDDVIVTMHDDSGGGGSMLI